MKIFDDSPAAKAGLKVGDIFEKNPLLFKDFIKYSSPVIINELIWGAGFSANARRRASRGRTCAV